MKTCFIKIIFAIFFALLLFFSPIFFVRAKMSRDEAVFFRNFAMIGTIDVASACRQMIEQRNSIIAQSVQMADDGSATAFDNDNFVVVVSANEIKYRYNVFDTIEGRFDVPAVINELNPWAFSVYKDRVRIQIAGRRYIVYFINESNGDGSEILCDGFWFWNNHKPDIMY